MKAVAVFPGSREVCLIDLPEPAIASPTDVKLRILEVGICGTDREISGFHYGTPPEGQDHLIIGHEALGEVVDVGPGVTGFQRGDLAVLTVRRECGEPSCEPCKAGRQDFCSTGAFTERGIKGRHGYMTRFVVDDQRYLLAIPGDLRDVAVLVEPLTIAEKALIGVWQIQQRLPWSCPHGGKSLPGVCHHALILGAGPIGMLGAMAFRAAGFSTFVYSREPEGSDRARLVESFECTYISGATTPIDKLMERIGSIDVVYEATGASAMAFEVLAQCGPNAAFVFSGVPGLKGPVPLNTDLLMRRMVLNNQVLLGTVNAGRDAFEAAIRDLRVFKQRWPRAIGGLFTGRFPLERYREPLLSGAGIKSVVTM